MSIGLTQSAGILGMNARNLTYVRPNNRSQARKIADEKIRTKKVLRKAGLPVPKLLAKIESRTDLENFDWSTLPNSFALKPNRGLGGEGIVVVFGKKKGKDDTWVKADGSTLTVDDLSNHIQNILDGSFSLTNSPDTAFFEERLKLHKAFKPYSYRGIPDIRIIVYNKVPVMAMLRLPTKSSGGKANLQQGGIGVGIDMATGTTTTAILGKHRYIEYIPDSRLLLSGFKIPYWNDILEMAVRAQVATDIGFLGADVAMDRDRGPVILELNIRPGLSIQLSNKAGLKERLERVRGLKIKSVARGVRVGMSLFGGEIEEEVEEISGMRVIGSIETVKLMDKKGKIIEVKAKIDTGALSTSIDTELAKQLGFAKTLDEFDRLDTENLHITPENKKDVEKNVFDMYEKDDPDLDSVGVVFSSSGVTVRPVIKLSFTMDNREIKTRVNVVDRSLMKYDMIVGKRDLKRFLVDVSK